MIKKIIFVSVLIIIFFSVDISFALVEYPAVYTNTNFTRKVVVKNNMLYVKFE